MATFFEFECVDWDNQGIFNYYKVVNIDHISEWSSYRDNHVGNVIKYVLSNGNNFMIVKNEHSRFKRFLISRGHSVIVLDDYPTPGGSY